MTIYYAYLTCIPYFLREVGKASIWRQDSLPVRQYPGPDCLSLISSTAGCTSTPLAPWVHLFPLLFFVLPVGVLTFSFLYASDCHWVPTWEGTSFQEESKWKLSLSDLTFCSTWNHSDEHLSPFWKPLTCRFRA